MRHLSQPVLLPKFIAASAFKAHLVDLPEDMTAGVTSTGAKAKDAYWESWIRFCTEL
jgi:hypothetical protein